MKKLSGNPRGHRPRKHFPDVYRCRHEWIRFDEISVMCVKCPAKKISLEGYDEV